MMRSLLFVPANRPVFLASAGQRGADAVIVDLEDAVPEASKDEARAALADAVPMIRRTGTRVLVRVNAESERIAEDALAACRAGADALCVPKSNDSAVLKRLGDVLEPIEHGLGRAPMGFLPLVEDARGLFEAQRIATAPRVFGLGCGGEDLALSMNAMPDPDVLRLPHLLVHYAAKAAGIASIGILRSIVDFSDLDAMQAAALEAKRFGFDGACCIHPRVVPILNQAFAAGERELDWARKVVEAGAREAEQGSGAFMLEGKFVDAPILKRARMLLEEWARRRPD